MFIWFIIMECRSNILPPLVLKYDMCDCTWGNWTIHWDGSSQCVWFMWEIWLLNSCALLCFFCLLGFEFCFLLVHQVLHIFVKACVRLIAEHRMQRLHNTSNFHQSRYIFSEYPSSEKLQEIRIFRMLFNAHYDQICYVKASVII